MDEPGRLIASGRDSDIFEYGSDLVLRRARTGRSMALEARTMEYARSHGYPVPAVDSLSEDGAELVMERLEGPSMLGALERRPWLLRRCARILADLHQALHEIPAPEWVASAPCGEGDRLLHLDLHPLNVIMTPGGPVVIDWPNAMRGDPDVDVALTWALLACGEIPGGGVKTALLGRFRASLVQSFLAHFDLDPVRACLVGAVTWKARDAHMSAWEKAAMIELGRREGFGA
ncbi:MAG: phosphotransferase [Acidimicrobiales bacterium]|jgi:aminoglycoside phosphotransferase (APT) family kinase protein